MLTLCPSNSLVSLAAQNSLLTIIMHHSRVSQSPSRAYSATLAVLLNEILKGSISFAIAFSRVDIPASLHPAPPDLPTLASSTPIPAWHIRAILYRCKRMRREILSPDCWKLSIPALLYGPCLEFPALLSLPSPEGHSSRSK
jgi:UDP-sugar transporter A1/2/3